MTDGPFSTQLGEFRDDEFHDTAHRWTLERCQTPLGRWLEVREYQDEDPDHDSMSVALMAFPDHIAAQLAETILSRSGWRSTGEVPTGEMSAETLRVLSMVRQRDWLAYAVLLREIHKAGRECVDATIGQLACLALSAMHEMIDDENIDDVLGRWLNDATGDIDDDIDDAKLNAFLDAQKPVDE